MEDEAVDTRYAFEERRMAAEARAETAASAAAAEPEDEESHLETTQILKGDGKTTPAKGDYV